MGTIRITDINYRMDPDYGNISIIFDNRGNSSEVSFDANIHQTIIKLRVRKFCTGIILQIRSLYLP